MSKPDPKKILFYIWVGFSTLSAAVSLASLVDGIVAWSDFIRSMIESYRLLVDGFWGVIFSFVDIDLSQRLNDYLTLNSLFAISITWGFYRTGDELGFGLASLREFIKNNLFDFRLGGNSFDIFQRRGLEKILDECGHVSENAQLAIDRLTREYPQFLLKAGEILSSLLLVFTILTCSFAAPAYLQWRDLRWNKKSILLMREREGELLDCELNECERSVIGERFNSLCVYSAESERKILLLYHRTFRRGIGWYLLAVGVMFGLLVFGNYAARLA